MTKNALGTWAKLTPRARTILWQIQCDGGLLRTYDRDSPSMYGTKSGRPIDPRIVQELFAKGELQANEDGLFPGSAQSWFVVHPKEPV